MRKWELAVSNLSPPISKYGTGLETWLGLPARRRFKDETRNGHFGTFDHASQEQVGEANVAQYSKQVDKGCDYGPGVNGGVPFQVFCNATASSADKTGQWGYNEQRWASNYDHLGVHSDKLWEEDEKYRDRKGGEYCQKYFLDHDLPRDVARLCMTNDGGDRLPTTISCMSDDQGHEEGQFYILF
jgi:hypothetical protein